MKMNKTVKALAGILLISHLSACGTILYPERKGQVSGQIDAGVAALNGIGLLFFLVPGVIAFAVDFNNGTIYLPNSGAVEGEDDGLRVVQSDRPLTLDEVNRVVAAETGAPMDLSQLQTEAGQALGHADIAQQIQQRAREHAPQ